MNPLLSRVDHLVYAAPDLDAAIESIAGLLGVPPSAGGQHRGRGTRNALVSLGPRTYLEVIGPDPEQPSPDGPRWFGIDDLLAPRLVTWAATAPDLDAAAARFDAVQGSSLDAGVFSSLEAGVSSLEAGVSSLEARVFPSLEAGVSSLEAGVFPSLEARVSSLEAGVFPSLEAGVFPSLEARVSSLEAGVFPSLEAGVFRPRRSAAAGMRLGPVLEGQRTRADGVTLTWRYTEPLVAFGDGIVPFLIDWRDTPHPAVSAATGGTLIALGAEHPRATDIEALMRALDLDLPIQPGAAPMLIATIETPHGQVVIR